MPTRWTGIVSTPGPACVNDTWQLDYDGCARRPGPLSRGFIFLVLQDEPRPHAIPTKSDKILSCVFEILINISRMSLHGQCQRSVPKNLIHVGLHRFHGAQGGGVLFEVQIDPDVVSRLANQDPFFGPVPWHACLGLQNTRKGTRARFLAGFLPVVPSCSP